MEQMGTTTILRSALGKLSDESLQELRQFAERHTYPPQTTLCHQGATEHIFYIVITGRVAVVRIREDGQEQIVAMRGPNEFFGEMSLIDDSPRSANCVTLVETTVFEVTEPVFDELTRRSPVVAHTILRRVLEMGRDNDQRLIEELRAKNKDLEQAYTQLKAAQAELVVKERLERELELAAQVQRNLLPDTLPQYPDYQFASYLRPARHVGGDFYDVVPIDDEHVGLLLADVADKGFHAALFMAVTRTLFLQESAHSLSPAEVALGVHHSMFKVAASDHVFVTAVYGVLHRPSGKLTYVRAGHDRPILYRPGQGIEILPGNGRFLGMWEELELTEYHTQLQPGDRLLFFSDGVPDAINPSEESYGNERLQNVLTKAGHLPADKLIAHIVSDIDSWVKHADPFDDLTMLAIAANQPPN